MTTTWPVAMTKYLHPTAIASLVASHKIILTWWSLRRLRTSLGSAPKEKMFPVNSIFSLIYKMCFIYLLQYKKYISSWVTTDLIPRSWSRWFMRRDGGRGWPNSRGITVFCSFSNRGCADFKIAFHNFKCLKRLKKVREGWSEQGVSVPRARTNICVMWPMYYLTLATLGHVVKQNITWSCMSSMYMYLIVIRTISLHIIDIIK